MIISETEALDIANRWGQASGSEPLQIFGKTGLVADRKRLVEAIDYVRLFLKDPQELDKLREYVLHPCPFEVAAREEGWAVEDDSILHIHDYDKAVRYKDWESCCESEDILLRNEENLPRKKQRRADR